MIQPRLNEKEVDNQSTYDTTNDAEDFDEIVNKLHNLRDYDFLKFRSFFETMQNRFMQNYTTEQRVIFFNAYRTNSEFNEDFLTKVILKGE